MPRTRHPRNLAGEGLAMRQQIRKALNRPQITQRDTDSGKAKKTSNAQHSTPNVELQRALQSPTQPELFS